MIISLPLCTADVMPKTPLYLSTYMNVLKIGETQYMLNLHDVRLISGCVCCSAKHETLDITVAGE